MKTTKEYSEELTLSLAFWTLSGVLVVASQTEALLFSSVSEDNVFVQSRTEYKMGEAFHMHTSLCSMESYGAFYLGLNKDSPVEYLGRSQCCFKCHPSLTFPSLYHVSRIWVQMLVLLFCGMRTNNGSF